MMMWVPPQVEEMRRDFEEKLRAFSQAQAQFEAEKRRALDDLRATHRHEVEELRHNQQNQSATSSEDQERMAELHRQEVGCQTCRTVLSGSVESLRFCPGRWRL